MSNHNHSTMRQTLKCRDVISVGDSWFRYEDNYVDDGQREVLIVTPRTNNPKGPVWLKPHLARSGDRVEIFKNVFITFTDISKKSRIRLMIEADKSIPITKGYPYERNLKLIHSNS
ncbi:hypothetical protein [uncultured Photobacterium sp.]|uniref:hypothetical protein n=1 Tax=uncultured Photobacterium sp. TaxID=173973 RepID=UPI00262DF96D|nr:hypothetical protein [uncultured Photobacterium sp.]